jgi:hypothetical protein
MRSAPVITFFIYLNLYRFVRPPKKNIPLSVLLVSGRRSWYHFLTKLKIVYESTTRTPKYL